MEGREKRRKHVLCSVINLIATPYFYVLALLTSTSSLCPSGDLNLDVLLFIPNQPHIQPYFTVISVLLLLVMGSRTPPIASNRS